MYATAIKMQSHKSYSNDLTEIDSIYIEGCATPGFFSKEVIHDYLRDNPGSISVKLYPYPQLIPATSIYGEKYVKSQANASTSDNLLKLPRY